MLTCLPQSLCSWNFDISGADAGPSALTFNSFFTDSGSIRHGLIQHKVRWDSLGEHWTLERHGQIVAKARRHFFVRRFDMTVGDSVFIVKAVDIFSNDFEILCGGSVVGTIRPVHAFTRRSSIQCLDLLPELYQVFAFWLVALTWKQATEAS